MVNRTIQAKVLKMKKERRNRPKLNPVKVSRAPNINVLKGYAERARGLAFDEEEVERWIVALWGRPAFKGVSPGRHEVLKKLAELGEKELLGLSFTVVDNMFERCRCYFNSERTCAVLVHAKDGKVRRSMEYGRVDRAIKAWVEGKVKWIAR